MSINKKVKKASEAFNKAADKLIKLVNKESSKKKILKQVDKVQDLSKGKKKLKKKASDIASKEKAVTKKVKAIKKNAKSDKKTTDKKANAASKKMDEKLLQSRSSIAKSKKIKATPSKKESAPNKPNKVAKSNNAEPKEATISIKMNARAAIYKITELSTFKELEDFIKGEKRKTVLERATARKNALTELK